MKDTLFTDNSTSKQKFKPSFSGHQTFPFRYTWLKKGYDAVKEDANVFTNDNATIILGVGKNMVQSIRHWCRVAGLIEIEGKHQKNFVPTELGRYIFDDINGFDPYLDDPATLWLIHWQIASNKNQATGWYWAFNILKKNQFNPETFSLEMHEWAKLQNGSMRPVSPNTLQRDVNCFIRTYCQSHNKVFLVEESFDCPLVELNLIHRLPDSEDYEFQRGKKDKLPVEIFAKTLIDFWRFKYNERDSLPFTELMNAPLSPGRVFRLDEDSMTTYLEQLEDLTDGALNYDETADLKQVYQHKDYDPTQLLKRYYG